MGVSRVAYDSVVGRPGTGVSMHICGERSHEPTTGKWLNFGLMVSLVISLMPNKYVVSRSNLYRVVSFPYRPILTGLPTSVHPRTSPRINPSLLSSHLRFSRPSPALPSSSVIQVAILECVDPVFCVLCSVFCCAVLFLPSSARTRWVSFAWHLPCVLGQCSSCPSPFSFGLSFSLDPLSPFILCSFRDSGKRRAARGVLLRQSRIVGFETRLGPRVGG